VRIRGHINHLTKRGAHPWHYQEECIGKSLRGVAGGKEVLTEVNLHILSLIQMVFIDF